VLRRVGNLEMLPRGTKILMQGKMQTQMQRQVTQMGDGIVGFIGDLKSTQSLDLFHNFHPYLLDEVKTGRSSGRG
jgi:hypothetical protein